MRRIQCSTDQSIGQKAKRYIVHSALRFACGYEFAVFFLFLSSECIFFCLRLLIVMRLHFWILFLFNLTGSIFIRYSDKGVRRLISITIHWHFARFNYFSKLVFAICRKFHFILFLVFKLFIFSYNVRLKFASQYYCFLFAIVFYSGFNLFDSGYFGI